MPYILYAIYLFLAVYLAGNMLTLQIQHYGIYSFVGRDNFKEYMNANNHSAFIPSVVPAMLLLVINISLFFIKPSFMSDAAVLFSLVLNITALVSTFKWQRKIQGEMVTTGYDENKITLLLSTNWIRVVAFFIQAIMVVTLTTMALK